MSKSHPGIPEFHPRNSIGSPHRACILISAVDFSLLGLVLPVTYGRQESSPSTSAASPTWAGGVIVPTTNHADRKKSKSKVKSQMGNLLTKSRPLTPTSIEHGPARNCGYF